MQRERKRERETHSTAAAMHENELKRKRQRVTEESGEFARPIKYAILFRAYNPNHLCLNFMWIILEFSFSHILSLWPFLLIDLLIIFFLLLIVVYGTWIVIFNAVFYNVDVVRHPAVGQEKVARILCIWKFYMLIWQNLSFDTKIAFIRS